MKNLILLLMFMGIVFAQTKIADDIPIDHKNRPVSIMYTYNADSSAFTAVKGADGKLRVSSVPYGYDIAEGNIPGHTGLYKFGSNEAVGTGYETIWTEGGLYNWTGVDAAEGIVKVSSTDVDDDTTGTGARTCTIYGLDTLGMPQNESFILDGQTGVNSTKYYSRVNRIICNTAGSTGANEGVIYVGTGTITTGVPAVKWAAVAVGKNQTLMAVWTVPADKTFYMTSFMATTNSNKGNIVEMYVQPTGELFQIKNQTLLFSSGMHHKFEAPLILSGGTDIDVRAIGTASGAGIAYSFEGWYE